MKTKTIVHKSAAPIYAAAATWLLYALLFPLYAVGHFLLAAVASAVVALIARMFCRDVTETVEIPEEPVSTGNVELDDLEDALDIELDQEEHDTLTGLVFDALGMIPDDGEQDITLEAEGMRIHVTSIADHQVNAAQVWLLPKEAPAEDEE